MGTGAAQHCSGLACEKPTIQPDKMHSNVRWKKCWECYLVVSVYFTPMGASVSSILLIRSST